MTAELYLSLYLPVSLCPTAHPPHRVGHICEPVPVPGVTERQKERL